MEVNQEKEKEGEKEVIPSIRRVFASVKVLSIKKEP